MNIFRNAAAIASLLLTATVAADEVTFTEQQVCRAAIATIMHKDIGIVSAAGEGTISVTYNSGGLKKFKCRIEGSSVMWGSADGRWRNQAYDEKVMWEAAGDTLVIRQPWSDGSVSTDKFTRDQF
jgi:hypothetical protein